MGKRNLKSKRTIFVSGGRKCSFSPLPARDWHKQTKIHESTRSLSFLRLQSSNQMAAWEGMYNVSNNVMFRGLTEGYKKRAASAAAAAKSLQSCLTLCNPTYSSPPGSPVPGILQARTLEWVSISFSNAWKWKVKGNSLSRARLLATPWTAAHQAPPSMGFSRQEYWSGVPLPSPELPLSISINYYI